MTDLELYREQRDEAYRIIRDVNSTEEERKAAKEIYAECNKRISEITSGERTMEHDIDLENLKFKHNLIATLVQNGFSVSLALMQFAGTLMGFKLTEISQARLMKFAETNTLPRDIRLDVPGFLKLFNFK